jgi:hypothetical protein
MIIAHPVGDQIADRTNFKVMFPCEGYKVVKAGHRPILVHDLADHAGWIEARQPRDIDRSFGMAGAHQCAAVAGGQWKDMSGGDKIISALGRINCDRNCARAVCCRNAGCDAFLRFDRNGEGGLH